MPVEYVQTVTGCGSYSPEEVIKMRNYGVPADFPCAARDAGYTGSADDVVKMRNHGVSADYLRGMTVPGRKPLPVDDLIALRSRGVDAATVHKLRE